MYEEVYSILSSIDKLSKDNYEQLISIYGEAVVGAVIESLIEEDEENLYRFEIYFSENNNDLEVTADLRNYDIYVSDISSIPCLDTEKNLMLMKRIYPIIQELEELFKILNCDDSILGGNKTPWIADKVKYCLDNCNDLELLNRLKELNDKFCYLRDIIVSGNLRWVILIASQYKNNPESTFDDVIQSGNMGLIRAVEKFNPMKGASFSNYSSYWIDHYIIRTMKRMKYSVKISEKTIYKNHHLLDARNELCLKLGRVVTDSELSAYTGVDVNEIKLMSKIFLEPLSLDESLNFGYDDIGDLPIVRCDLVIDDTVDVFEEVSSTMSLMDINNLLGTYLDDRELEVIKLYLGIGSASYTLKEIAGLLNISKQMVCRIKKKAINKLSKRRKLKLLLNQ